jgi:hypothetical protein
MSIYHRLDFICDANDSLNSSTTSDETAVETQMIDYGSRVIGTMFFASKHRWMSQNGSSSGLTGL